MTCRQTEQADRQIYIQTDRQSFTCCCFLLAIQLVLGINQYSHNKRQNYATDWQLCTSALISRCPWESLLSFFSLRSQSCCAIPHAEFGKWASLYQFVLDFQPTVPDRPPAQGLSLLPCRGWQCPPWARAPKPCCLNGHWLPYRARQPSMVCTTRRQDSRGMLMTSSISIFCPTLHTQTTLPPRCQEWQFVIRGSYDWNESTINVFEKMTRFTQTLREGLLTACSF